MAANPREFVLHAEKALQDVSPTEYATAREGYIAEAAMHFGTDAAREVKDALPDHPGAQSCF